jgi:hypothetical protein
MKQAKHHAEKKKRPKYWSYNPIPPYMHSPHPCPFRSWVFYSSQYHQSYCKREATTVQEILKIRDRRLLQSHGSTHRMQSVCDNIPTTLPSDLESVGYHSKCYRRFTAHLDRLKDDTNEEEEEASTSRQHHSPRKSTSVGSHGPLFPPECIFCEKLEIKGADRRIE